MKTKSFKSSLLLFLAAFIWGVAFVAQSVGMDYVGPFTFNAVRCFVGSFILIPVIFWNQKRTAKKVDKDTLHDRPKESILGGISCGILFFIATSLQQIGILYTSVGKAGFITACYIVIVPIIGLFLGKKCRKFSWAAVAMALIGLYIVIVPILGIFLKRKVNLKIWISVLIALVGLYLLCMSGSLTLTKGDALILLGALFFSFHILVVDYFSSKVSGVKLSCIQLFIASMLSAIPMFVLENPKLSSICAAWAPILYAGILSCGVAYTLQIIGQRNLNPTIASLILSLESVISVLAGWVILHQTLSTRELIGCVLMFAAILLAEL